MKRIRRTKVEGAAATYHCMTRVVNGERLFKDREKEVLRKMIWQLADFCGVEVLTYCIMSNHFHVLLRVPSEQNVDDAELLRRYQVLYPKPTPYQSDSIKVLRAELAANSEDAQETRRKLLARMGDISEYMKAVKQRFSVWYNRNHNRYGTLWADRFKSVLVEGRGNPLQTMAAYIDLNPVRAGLVEDPKDYRFCGYAEAVSGVSAAIEGLRRIWGDHDTDPLRAHRLLLFGQGSAASSKGGATIAREEALRVLEQEDGLLPKAAILRCRVRYFTDGAILGSAEFVRSYAAAWQMERQRRHPPKMNRLKGAEWGDLAVIRGLRKAVFS
ncbi:transposase [Coraliomargarita sp. SDUM461003]|uniref:Transposase n=1 Tax=Thalassobacterium maritimum TaxID=3041265 RepID=A0ABU1AYI1_9BACT|nr:transposase [Coraliomargarita sp. SDUM461003]MDQ8209218.1 transposase [Coraliomargarita sp. SDUM461003]